MSATMKSRRSFLKQVGAGLVVSYAGFPGLSQATTAPGSPLFVFLNLGGGADGLDMIRPVFDVGYQNLRAKVPNSLDGFDLGASGQGFKLNKSLPKVLQLYSAGQALLFHAVGLNYTTAATALRSHFASQQMLQSMSTVPYRLRTGVFGRLSNTRGTRSMADGALIPTVLQGPRKDLINTCPSRVGRIPTEDFVRRWASMHGDEFDMVTLINNAYQAAKVTLPSPAEALQGRMKNLYNSLQFGLVSGASHFSVNMGGWDAHNGEWDSEGVYAQLLELDEIIGIIQLAFAERWNDVVVLATSEFGRTVAVNGSNGTDHGTGTIAMLMGGKVNGGRVVTRWPGLQPAQLYQGRDLAITMDVQQLHASALSTHFQLNPVEQKAIFPMPLANIPEFAAANLFKTA